MPCEVELDAKPIKNVRHISMTLYRVRKGAESINDVVVLVRWNYLVITTSYCLANFMPISILRLNIWTKTARISRTSCRYPFRTQMYTGFIQNSEDIQVYLKNFTPE